MNTPDVAKLFARAKKLGMNIKVKPTSTWSGSADHPGIPQSMSHVGGTFSTMTELLEDMKKKIEYLERVSIERDM